MTNESFIIDDGLTHYGNALRFQKAYKNQFKYNPAYGKWYRWNGVVWSNDVDGEVIRSFHIQNMLLSDMAESCEDKNLKVKIQAWCKSSESYNNISSSEKLARHMSQLSTGSGWDNKPFLFAVQNGIVDLTTGELLEPNPNDLLTLQSPVIYDKKAECPLWEKFIFEAFDGDLDLIHYVQKALGYSITGNTKEQVVFIGHGTGSNGKSTMLRILLKILGDYGYTAPRQTFQLKYISDQTNDIAQLPGKRFVSWSETRVNTSFDEEKIKAITGGENQRARMLYQDFFEFQPVLKLWMFFNHKPTARDDSQGFWRRMRVIPFNHVFDGKDKEIDVKLSNELPGILNWLIQGSFMWQAEGLDDLPGIIKEATNEYQLESDPLNEWITECINIDNLSNERAGDLYKSYYNWAIKEGYQGKEILTNVPFGKRMKIKFPFDRDMHGIFYIGLSIIKEGM